MYNAAEVIATGAAAPRSRRQARMAAASDYFALGREMGNQRRSDVAMNTPVVRDDES